ncbi:hypothetical protein M4J06_003838 [Streptomyces coelicoflavus]|uniref:hypothetical protein n=1 Tax=Streptomyces coelicoflavus TaxID=285562 RepID=UPI00210C3EFC|nr:hypothetical protein [Streptomyces coelicoflavus]MCQ4205203.1 hypothetical protein [Streptomyces coelicoflavus]
MTNDRGPSPLDPDFAYRDASIYVDAEAAPRVVGRLRDLLGLVEDDGAELVVGPVRVEGEPNGYATGQHAHAFDFLQWPTVLECEATAGAPAEEVVQAVAAVLGALWRGGFKAVAACDFEDELPARGGIDRYPLPAPGSGSGSGGSGASGSSWWRNMISPGKRKDRMS